MNFYDINGVYQRCVFYPCMNLWDPPVRAKGFYSVMGFCQKGPFYHTDAVASGCVRVRGCVRVCAWHWSAKNNMNTVLLVSMFKTQGDWIPETSINWTFVLLVCFSLCFPASLCLCQCANWSEIDPGYKITKLSNCFIDCLSPLSISHFLPVSFLVCSTCPFFQLFSLLSLSLLFHLHPHPQNQAVRHVHLRSLTVGALSASVCRCRGDAMERETVRMGQTRSSVLQVSFTFSS